MSALKLYNLPDHILQSVCRFAFGHRDTPKIVPFMRTCKALYEFVKRTPLKVSFSISTDVIRFDGRDTIDLPPLIENNPQWKISKLNVFFPKYMRFPAHLNVDDSIYPRWIYNVLEKLEDKLQDHLEYVRLCLDNKSSVREEWYVDVMADVAEKLASFNDNVMFEISDYCGGWSEKVYEKLPRTINVISLELNAIFQRPSSLCLKSLNWLQTLVLPLFSGRFYIDDVNHMHYLSFLKVDSLDLPTDELMSFSFPKLKRLELFDQEFEYASEKFGAIISSLFPSLESFSLSNNGSARNIGLDNLPKCCVSLTLDYERLSTISKDQFQYLHIRVSLENTSCLPEQIKNYSLKALSFLGSLEPKNISTHLDLITRVVTIQPRLLVLQLDDRSCIDRHFRKHGDKIIDDILSWRENNEQLLDSSDIMLISYGREVIYMKSSLDFRFVQLMKYLDEDRNWVFREDPTNLILDEQEIHVRYSKLKSAERLKRKRAISNS